MTKDAPKRHHWWPVCVSKHWADSDGGVHWILPDGNVRRARPDSFGVIGNGHSIKLNEPGETSPWDQNYEAEFQAADDAFPRVIEWLDGLERAGPPFEIPRQERILPQQITDEQFLDLLQCVVSLAVRSPMHRERSVSLAEHLRGPLPERERNNLIGANMRNAQRDAVKVIRGRGTFMAIFSPEREFHFGDGFFHNISPPVQHLHAPKILVPVTPWLTVLFTCPMSFRTQPRLCTMTATADEAAALNRVVQVYAKNQLFYRSEKPALEEAYRSGRHLEFSDDRNPADDLFYSVPGVDARDDSLDWLGEFIAQSRP